MCRAPASKKLQSSLESEMAEQFDTTPLHNSVYDAVAQDAGLERVCDAYAAIAEASNTREKTIGLDEHVKTMADASVTHTDIARERALEVVADACLTLLQDGDQWAAEGHWTESEISDARYEARTWLQAHLDVAERIDARSEATAEVDE